jgi:hypothetical protein
MALSISDYKSLFNLSISSMERIEVSSETQDLITIWQVSGKGLDKNLDNLIPKLKSLNKISNKGLLTKEKLKKCLSNTFYSLTLFIGISNRIELVFDGYDNFKFWLNGLNCLINNAQILSKLNIQITQSRKYILV